MGENSVYSVPVDAVITVGFSQAIAEHAGITRCINGFVFIINDLQCIARFAINDLFAFKQRLAIIPKLIIVVVMMSFIFAGQRNVTYGVVAIRFGVIGGAFKTTGNGDVQCLAAAIAQGHGFAGYRFD
ncbi:MAG: hypothetical protein ACI9FJ_003363 [Alteromonadaceae bacterium]